MGMNKDKLATYLQDFIGYSAENAVTASKDILDKQGVLIKYHKEGMLGYKVICFVDFMKETPRMQRFRVYRGIRDEITEKLKIDWWKTDHPVPGCVRSYANIKIPDEK